MGKKAFLNASFGTASFPNEALGQSCLWAMSATNRKTGILVVIVLEITSVPHYFSGNILVAFFGGVKS